MRSFFIGGGALVALALSLSACGGGTTSGNTAVEPIITNGANPLAQDKLQLALGVANIGGTIGTNVVATLRKPDGTSGVLVDTPTLTGPFTVPASKSAFNDAGTNTISGQPQSTAVTATFVQTNTFGDAGGIFGYGIAPQNFNPLSTRSGFSASASNPFFGFYALPFYAPACPSAPAGACAPLTYRGGPPAYPNVRDGTFPSGFTGYGMGFTTFAMTPAIGVYRLTVDIPSVGALTASTSLTAVSGSAFLPTLAPPTFTPDGNGGGTIGNLGSIVPPMTEAFAIVLNSSGKCFPGAASGTSATYTVQIPVGALAATLPGNLGPSAGGGASHSICTATEPASAKFNAQSGTTGGDKYSVYLVGADYPLFEAGYPGNTTITPAIVGSNGQADITTSFATSGVSP